VQELDLTFIGTGNAFAPDGLCWNGFLANRRYLFEAPPQALMSLQRLGVDPNEVEAIVLSHHHGDHFLGLPFLMLYWKYRGRRKPVKIIGPPETESVTRQIAERTYPTLFELSYDLEWIEARPGQAIRVGELRLEPVEVEHDEKLTLNLGYAADLGGRRFGYTGDSALCDSVLDLARHSEVLVTECASREERVPTHMNLRDDMPVLRRTLAPDATLILTHLDAGIVTNDMQNAIVAQDYETYRL
jgi:ribonuclease BN (tRNA processing enzyme)